MAKNQDNALRLMVVDDSMEDAEAIVSSLRNAGIAVRRCARFARRAVRDVLRPGIDMVLAALGSANLPLEGSRAVQASGGTCRCLRSPTRSTTKASPVPRPGRVPGRHVATPSCCSTRCAPSATTWRRRACAG